MHVFDPSLTIAENCRIADDLSHAAWQFAGEDHKEEYRDCGADPQRSAWLEYVRLQDLKDALVDEEAIAFGIADHDPNIEIRQIPSAIFTASDLRLDGERMTVEALGRTFRDVKVCLAPIAELQTGTGGEISAPAPDMWPTSKVGRKDTYPLSSMVLHRLLEDEANRQLSAERLHPEFETAFAKMHPKVPPPSMRTLRKQLQRFRQESAEIGNN
jgi:hypothetical protein